MGLTGEVKKRQGAFKAVEGKESQGKECRSTFYEGKRSDGWGTRDEGRGVEIKRQEKEGWQNGLERVGRTAGR